MSCLIAFFSPPLYGVVVSRVPGSLLDDTEPVSVCMYLMTARGVSAIEKKSTANKFTMANGGRLPPVPVVAVTFWAIISRQVRVQCIIRSTARVNTLASAARDGAESPTVKKWFKVVNLLRTSKGKMYGRVTLRWVLLLL